MIDHEYAGPGSIIGSSTHRAFTVTDDSVHIANGVDVQMDDGRNFIRVCDYLHSRKNDLRDHFDRVGISEVTFSREVEG